MDQITCGLFGEKESTSGCELCIAMVTDACAIMKVLRIDEMVHLIEVDEGGEIGTIDIIEFVVEML